MRSGVCYGDLRRGDHCLFAGLRVCHPSPTRSAYDRVDPGQSRGTHWTDLVGATSGSLGDRENGEDLALLVRHLMTCYNAVTIVATQEEAMRTVGVRELEENIDEVLEQMRETGEVVAVTRGGEIIAHLVPASTPQWLTPVPDGAVRKPENVNAPDNAQDIWARLDRLSAEISAHWPKDVSAVDAIRDVRREL